MKFTLLFIIPVFVLSNFANNVKTANILGMFHMPTYSHNIAAKTLFKALARKGHHVTMISTFPLKPPMENYEDIYIPELLKFKEDGAIKMLTEVEDGTVFEKVSITHKVILKMNEICLSDKSVQDLLSSNKTFDLVMMDWIFTDSILGVADHYKAPVIAMSAAGSTVLTNKVMVNPSPFSYVPNLYSTGSDEMDFIERLINTLSTLIFELNEHLIHGPAQDAQLHQFFPNAPPIGELIKNISLLLLNSHFSIESPRPYVPAMIQIGGIHMEEPKTLDGSLQAFMDEAKEGVLYFSLGGNAKSEDLRKHKIEAIIRVFAKLPVKVLWKIDMEGKGSKMPSNIRTEKWIPQSDLLAHPNMKVFVSHGGLLSITEAVYRGIPMVGIPIFAEQDLNVKNAVNHGYSTIVKMDDLTEETLYAAIMDVLNNPKYRENMQKRSSWLKDQPLQPLDKAVFWVEYVLRHKGASHLKTSAINLKWYQYYLIDVVGFLVCIVIICLVVSWKIGKPLVKILLLVTKRANRVKKAKTKREKEN